MTESAIHLQQNIMLKHYLHPGRPGIQEYF